jgi:ATP diphosphatase
MEKQKDIDKIEKLLDIMAALRDPQSGCPWDLAQDFASIAPYTIEEAYEVADAIERRAWDALADELGDLLLQVVFHARMAEEQGRFAFTDVVARICDKMQRRHPHVFGDASVAGAEAQTAVWENIKADERREGANAGVLDDVPLGLPALTRAAKLGRRAARVGFDWAERAPVRAKVAEELAELDEAVTGQDRAAIRAEMGDVLFALVNLCRHLELDPERCLRESNARFERRFGRVEQLVNERGGWRAFDLDGLERLWGRAKSQESTPEPDRDQT